MSEPLVIHGERYVTATRAAELYGVRVEWVLEIASWGLLDPVERVGEELAIAARLLDRLATIHRLNLTQGVDLPGIAVFLDSQEPDA